MGQESRKSNASILLAGAKELSQKNLCFYTVLLNAFRTACSLHTCRYAPHKQLENQIRIFGENSIVYFVPAPKLKAENQEGRFTTDGIPLAGLT